MENDFTVLTFGPEKIIDGIIYHLLDMGFCTLVNPTVAALQLRRLRQEKTIFTFSNEYWRSITDNQKLYLLLHFSKIKVSFKLNEALLQHDERVQG